MNPVHAVAAIAFVFLVLLAWGFLQAPPDRAAQLRREALQLSARGAEEGAVFLAERILALRVRFPGKSDAWLLQWLVEDLKRAKR